MGRKPQEKAEQLGNAEMELRMSEYLRESKSRPKEGLI